MIKPSYSFSNVYLASDLLTEIKALIDKHIAKNRGNYIWHKELGKDLLNYLSRPDFLIEAVHYIRTLGVGILYSVVAEFLQTITEAQIKSLIETKSGWALVDEFQGWLLSSAEPFNFPSADKNLLAKFNSKIDSVRVPLIANDKRPYVGEMVGKDEDLGIQTSRFPQRAPFYTYRFGGGHDGEHWLTKSVGAEVRATAGIQGLILTHYYQGEGLWSVMIWLDNTKTVLLLKDLATLGEQIKKSFVTTPDNKNTPRRDETKFVGKNEVPFSKIRINAGELIGTTMPWENKYGTFHFAVLKYEKAQDFRSKKGTGGNVSDDLVKYPNAIPIDWFIPVLSPQSPVKCFK